MTEEEEKHTGSVESNNTATSKQSMSTLNY